MKYFQKILVFVTLSFFATYSFACKDAALNKQFPIKDFKGYDTIVIATITDVIKNKEQGYDKILSFSAIVKETIKGSVAVDSNISGQPTIEPARAVCNTSLAIGATYLLLLNKQGNIYNLSRFSFPTKNDHIYYLKYVQEVKAGVRQN